MDKIELRKKAHWIRNNVSDEDRSLWNRQLTLSALNIAKSYNTIALFHSFKSEIDTHALIKLLLDLNKRVALPKIVNGQMIFIEIQNPLQLKKGHFNVFEPIGSKVIEPECFDLIFVPMLAFNTKLYRIGYGKGYYDVFLKKTKGMKCGLAFDVQKLDVSFEVVYDVACDIIITEERIYEKEII